MSREEQSRSGKIGSSDQTREERGQFEGRKSGSEGTDSWGDENVGTEESSTDRSRSSSRVGSDEDRLRSDRNSGGKR